MSFDPTNPTLNQFATTDIDPALVTSDTVLQYETELVIGRRSFASAQAAFSLFQGVQSIHTLVSLSWHGTNTDVNEGSFAVVQTGSALEELVGEIVRVKVDARSVYAYVVTAADISVDMTLARRPFMAVGLLAQSPGGLNATVEVLQ